MGIRAALRRNLWLVLLLLAALAGAGIYAARLVHSAHVFSEPVPPDQPLAGWMTPRYVSHSWKVPPEVIAGALGMALDGTGRRVTLDELAAQRGEAVQALIARLDAAIDAYRQGGGGG